MKVTLQIAIVGAILTSFLSANLSNGKISLNSSLAQEVTAFESFADEVDGPNKPTDKASVAPFFERFDFQRDKEGRLQQVTIKNAMGQVSFDVLVDELRADIEALQFSGLTEMDIMVETLGEDMLSTWSVENKDRGYRSINELRKLDVNKTFSNERLKKFIKKFQEKFWRHLKGHNVVADVVDTRFFYSRAVSYQVVTWGLKLAKRFFDEVPVLNVATFIVKNAEKQVMARRKFHQNMLLHYLENFSAEALKISEEERQHALSSIYEARIPWFAFWESNIATRQWKTYGEYNFNVAYTACDNKLLDYKSEYDVLGRRLNYAFHTVVEKGQRKVINLKNNQHQFSSKPSTAYYFDEPKKVEKQRRLFRLIQLGSRFLPIPQFVRGIFENFMKSMYKEQIIVEGALHAYLETMKKPDEAETIAAQTINPFLGL